GLGKAGLNIGATAVLLGIHQEAINDFTPSDIAHLIRYVRINNPGLLKAVSDALNELLPAPPTVADHAASRIRKAA
ncbi:MAG TPA: hypothetical protein VLZ81_16325, partial [Blastocatellia bacterium]|nr:hypothetical protein [Blastocatellia bacterium]